MCGIIGSFAKNASGFSQKDVDIYTQMLYADAVRGWDATGVFGIDKIGNIDVKKSARAAGPFIQTTNYKAFTDTAFKKYTAMVGHNRKATHGEKRHEDAHPFWDKQDKIVLVHNGMISNHKEFCDTSTVDSAAIANALAEGDVDDVISRVQGAFAFVWYNTDEKKVYLIRNDLRPLNVVETSNAFHFSSELGLASWVTARNDQTILKTIPLKPWTLYSYDTENRSFEEVRAIAQKKQFFPVVTSTTPIITIGTRGLTDGTEARLFLTDDDLKNSATIDANIGRGDLIQVWFTGYKNISERTVKVHCSIINTDADNIEMMMYCKGDLFDSLDLTKVHSVIVSNIVHDVQGTTAIYVRLPQELVFWETTNDVVVTELMWKHPDFPCVCDICGELTKREQLPHSEVLIISDDQFLLMCPHCVNRS